MHYETASKGLMYRVVCLFTPQLSLIVIVPSHTGMAIRLSGQLYCRYGLLTLT